MPHIRRRSPEPDSHWFRVKASAQGLVKYINAVETALTLRNSKTVGNGWLSLEP